MSKEDILTSLNDLIESLKDKDKVNSPVFRTQWLKKKRLLDEAIDTLSKPDFDWLSTEYRKTVL